MPEQLSLRFRALTKGRVQLVVESQLRETELYVRAHLEKILAEVRPYPAVPPGSRYQRTGTLFNSWEIIGATTFSQIDMRLVNYAQEPTARAREYAVFVQGKYQWWRHAQTGWKRVDDYADRVGYTRGLRAILGTIRVGVA